MANRYWVGGTAPWSTSAGLKWSTTSGGAGGAAVPTAADDVYFDANSGAAVVTLNYAASCRSLSFTSPSGDFTGEFAGTTTLNIAGNLTLVSGMTLSYSGTLTFSGTGSQTITTNGKSLLSSIIFNGVGGSWLLQDALTIPSSKDCTLTNGTLDANNKNVSIGSFALGAGTKTLTLGSGTWTVTGTPWNCGVNTSNFTLSASVGTISMTSGSAKTFVGGGKTWPTLNQGGIGALTIQQSNTFANITNTVQPATITLTAGTTQTVGTFGVSGTSGNLITLNTSSAGSRATISRASGLTNVSNVSVKDIAATGQAFFAYTFNGNVNGGNTSGIRFNLPDSATIPSMFI